MEIINEIIAQYTKSWDNSSLPNYPTSKPRIKVIHVVLPPGVALDRHTHDRMAVGIVTQGELTLIRHDGFERTFKKGESIMEMVGTVHYGENRGSEPAEVYGIFLEND